MDEQIVDLLRDQFKDVHDKMDNLSRNVQNHVEKAERYWAKLDQQEGQMSVWKWLTTPGLAGFFAWLYNAFKH